MPGSAPNGDGLRPPDQALLADCGIAMQGDASQPHLRVTPLGTCARLAIAAGNATAPLPASGVCVVGISGFGDFQPHLAAASLNQHGVTAEAQEIDLPLLDVLRDNPSEFRAANIARRLDDETTGRPCWRRCARWRSGTAADHARLLWPRRRSPVPVAAAAPALPAAPAADAAAVGARDAPARPAAAAVYPQRRHLAAGDEVIDISHRRARQRDLDAQSRRYSAAPAFYRAGQRQLFSNGLVAERSGVREPILGLDLQQTLPRERWYQRTFCLSALAALRPENRCDLRPQLQGQPLENLFAIGSLLGGFDAIALGCGGGVCAVTALHAAGQIGELAGGEHERYPF
jgi:glycerol-3-phosphate dehydrogenase subunit B